MSSSVFPSLAGQGWDIVRTPMWDTEINTNNSGKETRLANQTYPRYQYDVTFDVLRQGIVHGTAYTEFSQLMGFYNSRQGQFDSFLYTDKDDNAVTDQAIGLGDGATTTFQLVRSFGGYVEPILAPNVVTNVKVNGVTKTPGTDYTVSSWGSSAPGVITFAVAPGNALAITSTFSFYWPCRFTMDKFPLNKFMSALYAGKKLSFLTLKN